MFQIIENKVFMDSVHGYISVPKCFVNHLIDTKMFQRLRNIDQTGMRVLYPTAKHDRFGHSLGVYYLGCKAVDALLDNFSKDLYWAIQSDRKAVLYWAKNKLLFVIACLLHDIGHVPFSHSLENEVVDNSISDEDNHKFKKELAEMICKIEDDEDEEITPDSITAAAHEQIGARYILEHFFENIAAVYDDLIKEGYPNVAENGLLYAENYDGQVLLTKDTINQDICFIVRMILGLKYIDYRPEKQIRNCFIELLNSSNFDVDKLDYILRDTKMSGISNVNVDVERLLGSISIVTKTVYKAQKNFSTCLINDTIYELETNIKKKIDDSETREEPDLENGIYLKGNMKGDIMLLPGTNVKICEGSKFRSLGEDNKKTEIIAYVPNTHFSATTEIIQNGDTIKKHKDICPLDYDNHKPYQCVIRNAEIVKGDYSFTVRKSPTVLSLDGECEITIAGICKLKGVLATLGSVIIKGDFVNLELLGNKLGKNIPNKSAYNEFSVGYKRQALNVIANVLEARDYLYLWIYAHHKVIYYANYLIPVLAKNVFETKKPSKAVRWQLNYENILYLDDYYVWNQIKQTVFAKGTKAYDLYNELFERKYKYSVYKSLAEFDLLFSNCSNKLSIQSRLRENINHDQGCLRDNSGNAVAGYLKKDFVKKLKKFAEKNNLKKIQYIRDIVFVEAMYKAKPINPHNTLIFMGDRVAAMEEIPLLKDKSSFIPRNTTYYFYLYYTIDECSTEEVPIITGQIKQLLQLYFSKKS